MPSIASCARSQHNLPDARLRIAQRLLVGYVYPQAKKCLDDESRVGFVMGTAAPLTLYHLCEMIWHMTPKIYLIDDNPANQRLISWVVDATKCELRSFLDAETGLEACFSEPPDLVLLDIGLPGMNGEEACKALKDDARTAHIPIVAVTANNMPGDKEYLLSVGFDDYLGKPITRLELSQLITRYTASG